MNIIGYQLPGWFHQHFIQVQDQVFDVIYHSIHYIVSFWDYKGYIIIPFWTFNGLRQLFHP